MNIDNRLAACAEFVSDGGTVCDVGTDHAYLAAFLVSTGKCPSAIAADINLGPLEAAKQTLEKYGLSDKIRLIQSDGLDGIPPEGITDIVIAGMGAELICDILSRAEWIKNGTCLILQPMTRTPTLRKWLYSNGFRIVEEKAVSSERFHYAVIRAEYCGEVREVDDTFSVIGELDFSDLTAREYAEKQVARLEKEYLGLQKSNPNSERAASLKKIAEDILKKLEEYI